MILNSSNNIREYYCTKCKIFIGKQYYETTVEDFGYHVINYECFDALKYMPSVYNELKEWLLFNTTSDFVIKNVIQIDNEKIIKDIIE